VDDFYWIPTAPPFVSKRPEQERVELMQKLFLPRDAWVMSGSMTGWGDSLVASLDAVVFITLDPETRLQRLRARETARYGDAIAPGGPREQAHQDFIEWARGYDDPTFTGRSRAGHEQWLTRLSCPVLRLDGAQSIDRLATAVIDWERAAA